MSLVKINQAAIFRGLPRGRFAGTMTLASSNGRFFGLTIFFRFLDGLSMKKVNNNARDNDELRVDLGWQAS